MRSISFIKKWPLGLFCVLGVIFSAAGLHLNTPSEAIAGTGDNVSGWAWNEKYGWVSFNSFDCDPDEDNLFEGVPSGCPPSGVPRDYGVKISLDAGDYGQFSKYAWSSNLGWIYFGPDANLPTYGLTRDDDAPELPRQWAKLEAGDQIKGWAKILALGNDGWLRFDHGKANQATIDLASGEMHGYAWNGNGTASTGIGWLSFNCAEGGATGSSVCGTSDYKVVTNVNRAPSVSNLTFGLTNPCTSARQIMLDWDFSDEDEDDQRAYHITISQYSDLHDPVINRYVESANSQFPISGADSGLFNYGLTYHWSVRVEDDRGASSTLPNPKSDFTVPAHEYPVPSFTITPDNPSQDQETLLTSNSEYYNMVNVKSACPLTGTCTYSWTHEPDGCVIIDQATASSTKATFKTTENCRVTLKVTDPQSYSCSTYLDTKAKLGLPNWRETR